MEVGLASEDPALRAVLRYEWDAERRLKSRPAFRIAGRVQAQKLHVFKVGRTVEFVTAVRPSPLDPEHVVDSIREVLLHLRAHPGCTREQLVATLRTGAEPGSEPAKRGVVPARLADRPRAHHRVLRRHAVRSAQPRIRSEIDAAVAAAGCDQAACSVHWPPSLQNFHPEYVRRKNP